jgi:WD40 repeat protein
MPCIARTKASEPQRCRSFGLVLVCLRCASGTCVATGSTDGSIKLWDLRSSRLIQYYEAHQGAVTDLSFHPSGNFLLSSSLDTSLKVRGVQGPEIVFLSNLQALLYWQLLSKRLSWLLLSLNQFTEIDSAAAGCPAADLGPAGGPPVLHPAWARGSGNGRLLLTRRHPVCLLWSRPAGDTLLHILQDCGGCVLSLVMRVVKVLTCPLPWGVPCR